MTDTDEDMTGVISFHNEDNKTILRLKKDGTMTLGEGLSQDEATQETARILKNFYDLYTGKVSLLEEAAPDLLEALEELARLQDHSGPTTTEEWIYAGDVARKAIAKAKGEPS